MSVKLYFNLPQHHHTGWTTALWGHTMDQHHTRLRVEDNCMGTHTGSTPHWVEDSSMGTSLNQRHTELRIALWGHTGPTPHWVEDSSMETHTGPMPHWLRIALWGHTLDQHHTGLRQWSMVHTYIHAKHET